MSIACRAMKMTMQAVLCLLLCVSTRAFAVSLGDELILSSLGDPVEVEIEVLQWEDMDLERVQISAATREEYEVFDLTWLPVLENLNFNMVGPDLNGKVRVLVSSRDPLNEPFLELLLVLRWPGGSLRREYVLLFDPPGSRAFDLTPVVETPPADLAQTPPQLPQQAAAPVAPVVEAPVEEQVVVVVEETPPPVVQVPAVEEEPVIEQAVPAEPPVVVIVEETVVEESETALPPPEPETTDLPDVRTQVAIEVETVTPQPASVPLDTDRRSYQVRSGDSLWNIARQFRPAGAGDNLYQVLLSIHNLNRNSFINGNISLLKANAVLQVPTIADIERIDALTAEAEFDRRWDEGTQRFEAAQRGEAIPLFADRLPPEAPVAVEAELPPGVEAPAAEADEDALIMVSQTNVPQPLQIAANTGTVDMPQADAASATLSNAPEPATTQTPIINIMNTTAPALAGPADDATASGDPRAGAIGTVVRSVFTAELETEVAAMRARRQSAEALAQQLQASLEQARAQRAAEASIFGTENLVLAGSAVMLFVALMAAIVFSLRIAGELRLRRSSFADTLPELVWRADEVQERKEPHMPDMTTATPQPETRAKTPTNPPAKEPVKDSDDLFARMDDMLHVSAGNPPQNS